MNQFTSEMPIHQSSIKTPNTAPHRHSIIHCAHLPAGSAPLGSASTQATLIESRDQLVTNLGTRLLWGPTTGLVGGRIGQCRPSYLWSINSPTIQCQTWSISQSITNPPIHYKCGKPSTINQSRNIVRKMIPWNICQKCLFYWQKTCWGCKVTLKFCTQLLLENKVLKVLKVPKVQK